MGSQLAGPPYGMPVLTGEMVVTPVLLSLKSFYPQGMFDSVWRHFSS